MRLIDADALIVELKKDEERFDREAEDGKQNPQTCTDGYAEAMWSRANGIRDAIISIYDAPTIDAVEVVRCAECKYLSQTTLGMEFACWHGAHNVWGETGQHAGHTVCIRIEKLDHYCSYGEKRTD